MQSLILFFFIMIPIIFLRILLKIFNCFCKTRLLKFLLNFTYDFLYFNYFIWYVLQLMLDLCIAAFHEFQIPSFNSWQKFSNATAGFYLSGLIILILFFNFLICKTKFWSSKMKTLVEGLWEKRFKVLFNLNWFVF